MTKPASPEHQRTGFVSNTTIYYCTAAILTAIGVAAFRYAFSFSEGDISSADRIPFLIGYYFWVPLVVYWAWRSVLKRRKGTGLLLGALAFLVIALYQSQSIVHKAEADRRALTAMHSMFLELMDGKVIDRAQLLNAGEYSPFLLTTRKFLLQIKSDLQQYQRQIEVAQLGTMLSPQTLANTAAIARALASLDALQASLSQAQSDIMRDYDGVSRAMQSTSLPVSAREDLTSSFDRGVAQGKIEFGQFFDIERNLFATARDVLHFARVRQGFFAVHGNQLMFARHADLVTYDGYITQIRAEAAQESAWLTKQHNNLAQKAEILQNAANSIGH